MSRTTRSKPKKKRSAFRLFLKIVLTLLILVALGGAGYAIYLTKQAESAANNAYEVIGDREQSDRRNERVEPLEDNVSILFIGVDDSETRDQGADASRSDALILATLNQKTKTVKLLSIPRDSYVYIPHVGYKDKITHAHAYGGSLATIETVEEMLDIPIDYYVRMNFNAFIEIVDALGGIEANVPYKMLEKDELERYTVKLEPGFQKLDGREALALARTRKQDSDVERGKRQQEIIQAIAKEAASASSILKYDEVLEAVGNNMKTDMTFKEMKSFLSYATSGMPRIDTLNLDGTDDMSTGTYYYQLDKESLESTKAILKSHLGIKDERDDEEESSYTSEDNDSSNSRY